jgi:hypothetical protein
VVISDICDPSPEVTATVHSSDPDDALGLGDGNTTGDIRVTTPDGEGLLSSNDDPMVEFDPITGQLELRAERGGKTIERTYTVVVTATDASGNTIQATSTIIVPRDQDRR